MKYNSLEEKLRMPEYGRLVQKMADHALTIQDRAERLTYCKEIVRIMELLSQKQKKRKGADLSQKFWDHLAFITDYKLDIDYPVNIQRQDEHPQPRAIKHMQNHIRYRHYGALLERAIERAKTMEDESEKEHLWELISARMKQSLATWKKDNATNEKVAHDIEEYID